MGETAGSAKAKLFSRKPSYYVHCIITFFLMFVLKLFIHVPETSVITQAGAELLCVLAGLVWGLIFCGQVFTGILTLIAIGMTGDNSAPAALAAATSNNSLIMVVAFGGFVGTFSTSGVSSWIARKLVSAKVGRGHPWILSLLFLLAMYLLGLFTVGLVTMFAIWELLYQVADTLDVEQDAPWVRFMIMGVGLCTLLSGGVFAFQGLNAAYISMYQGITGATMNTLKYTLLNLPVTVCAMLLYLLAGRFLFRIDVQKIAKAEVNFEFEPLTFYQKSVLAALGIMLLALFWTSIMPAGWAISRFLNGLTPAGIIFIVDAVLVGLSFTDAEPFNVLMFKGFSWEIYFGLGATLTMASYITAEGTGIAPFLNQVISPLFSSFGGFALVALVLLIPALLTNVAANLVVCSIFITIVSTMGNSLGLNVAMIVCLLINVSNVALITPAGCPVAAIVFGNSHMSAKDAMKYGAVGCLATFLCSLLIGYPLGSLLF